MKNYKTLFLLFLIVTFRASAESFVYITDQLDIPIRADQNFGENIIRLLPSGTKLSLLQSTEDGWAQVQFDDTIGWIKSFYISNEPPAREELKKLTRTYNANKLLIVNLISEKAELELEVKAFKTQIEFLEIRKKALLEYENNENLVKELVSESDALVKIIDDQLNILESAYKGLIAAKIRSNWRYLEVASGWTAEVYIIQDRNGEISTVRIRNSFTGVSDFDSVKAFEDSIERAVYKSSPLPIAPADAVFNDEIILTFLAD